MTTVFDYIRWRGDLSFGNAPLCPVDALLFSALSYVPLESELSPDPKAEPERLSALAQRLFARGTKSKQDALLLNKLQNNETNSNR